MRVKDASGLWGEAVLEHCQILRFDDAGGQTTRKFYQLFCVKVEMPGSNVRYTVVCNFGPSVEAPVGSDLRGGTTVLGRYAGYRQAMDALGTQSDVKMRKGYRHFTEYSRAAQAKCAPKLLAELGLVAVPDNAVAPTIGTAEVAALTDVIAQAAEELSRQVSAGALGEAVRSRQELAVLLSQIASVLVNGEGQLEALDHLITKEIVG